MCNGNSVILLLLLLSLFFFFFFFLGRKEIALTKKLRGKGRFNDGSVIIQSQTSFL